LQSARFGEVHSRSTSHASLGTHYFTRWHLYNIAVAFQGEVYFLSPRPSIRRARAYFGLFDYSLLVGSDHNTCSVEASDPRIGGLSATALLAGEDTETLECVTTSDRL
jgi:hypothetical protein